MRPVGAESWAHLPAWADLAQTHRAQRLRGQGLAPRAGMGRARGFLHLLAEPQASKERTVSPAPAAPCRQVVPRAEAGQPGKHQPDRAASHAALGQAACGRGRGDAAEPASQQGHSTAGAPGVPGQPAARRFPWRSGGRAGPGLPLPASPALLPARPLPQATDHQCFWIQTPVGCTWPWGCSSCFEVGLTLRTTWLDAQQPSVAAFADDARFEQPWP